MIEKTRHTYGDKANPSILQDQGSTLLFKSSTLYLSASLAIGPPLFPPLLAILPVENRAHACSVSEIMTMS